MKKLLALTLALAMCLALAACGGSTSTAPAASAAPAASNAPAAPAATEAPAITAPASDVAMQYITVEDAAYQDANSKLKDAASGTISGKLVRIS